MVCKKYEHWALQKHHIATNGGCYLSCRRREFQPCRQKNVSDSTGVDQKHQKRRRIISVCGWLIAVIWELR